MSFFLLLLMMSLSTSAPPRTILLGFAGNGKTHFCNTFDGTNCGLEAGGEKAVTQEVYFGKRFIDSPGFGDSLSFKDVDDLGASLQSIYTVLVALNEVDLRAIAWIVPCMSHRTPAEALELMGLFVDMVGEPVPVIAIFNPPSADAVCVKKGPAAVTEFIGIAKTYGINVRAVWTTAEFDVATFEARFTESFRVIIPSDLHTLLAGKDPRMLATLLRNLRELQCETLPQHLASVRKEIATLSNSIRPESSIGACADETCDHVERATFKKCDREICAKYGTAPDCHTRFWVFVSCGTQTFCLQNEVVVDEGCLQANRDAKDRTDLLLNDCLTKSRQRNVQCLASRQADLKALRDSNADTKASIENLRGEEADTQAKLRTCNDANHEEETCDV